MIDNIKAIILDVDGVIVGEKIGYNSPHPNKEVTKALKSIQDSGIPISLLTGKPHFSITKEIKDSDLNNVHIADGGAVIIDPLDNIIVKQHIISKTVSQRILNILISEDIYTEFYTVNDYYVESSQKSKITSLHSHVLQRKPKVVDSLVDESKNQQITKLMPIVPDESGKEKVEKLLKPFMSSINLSWGVHPIANPHQFALVTAKGVSKKEGVIEISKYLNVPTNDMLGVGDSTSDWKFIELCGYKAAMGNASDELKQLVGNSKAGFVAPSVDENGIIKVFEHFGII